MNQSSNHSSLQLSVSSIQFNPVDIIPVKILADKKTCLGDLLYASYLLDEQLNTAIESGDIDTKIILNIRTRLGKILRSSIPADIPAPDKDIKEILKTEMENTVNHTIRKYT